mgnify:CR=1 FL=1
MTAARLAQLSCGVVFRVGLATGVWKYRGRVSNPARQGRPASNALPLRTTQRHLMSFRKHHLARADGGKYIVPIALRRNIRAFDLPTCRKLLSVYIANC